MRLAHSRYMKMGLEERRAYFNKRCPDTLRLEKKLTTGKFRGTKVIYTPELYYLSKLVERGTFTDPTKFLVMPESVGAENRCHDVAVAFHEYENADIFTGYALSANDGLWRQHSWFEYKGELWEGTPIKRDAYFGFRLTDAEAKRFGNPEAVLR